MAFIVVIIFYLVLVAGALADRGRLGGGLFGKNLAKYRLLPQTQGLATSVWEILDPPLRCLLECLNLAIVYFNYCTEHCWVGADCLQWTEWERKLPARFPFLISIFFPHDLNINVYYVQESVSTLSI